MEQQEAARLVKCCAPLITGDKNAVTEYNDVTVRTLCSLWGGMGYIYVVRFAYDKELVVKRIMPPPPQKQSFGDRRKAFSYEVEANFYQNFAPELIEKYGLAIPTPYLVERGSLDNPITICMSHLLGGTAHSMDRNKTRAVLEWLATLHASTWGRADDLVQRIGLQPVGSYWHLDTRPDEHASMRRGGWEGRLKLAARAIDSRLKRDKMQCIIHGDAKDANMLFFTSNKATRVAMYDFQYCGKAPPTVDLAYFLTVGTDDDAYHDEMLQFYHEKFIEKLCSEHQLPTLTDLQNSLSMAYCDLVRFMVGWGVWGHDLSSRVVKVLDRLDGGRNLGSEEAYDQAVRREYG